MHFDGIGIFVHKRKPKIFRSISQVKGEDSQKVFLKKGAKIRKKYSLGKGRVLQKYFKYSSIMKKESNCLSSLQGMEKRDFQVHYILLSKNCMTKFRFDSWGLRYPPATGIRFSERDEPRPAFRGGRLCSAPLRPGFAGAAQLQKQEDDPTYWETSTSTLSGEDQTVNVSWSL